MCELRLTRDDIADGVELGLGRFEKCIGLDETTVEFRVGLFEANIFGERTPANGNQNFLRADGLRFPRFVFVCDRSALGILLHRFDFCFKLDLHTLLAENLLKFGGNFLVLERHHTRQRFEQRHIRSERFENGSELDPDGAAAHHDHRLGNFLKAQNFAVREDDLAVDFDAWQRTRFGTGGEHRVGRFDF